MRPSARGDFGRIAGKINRPELITMTPACFVGILSGRPLRQTLFGGKLSVPMPVLNECLFRQSGTPEPKAAIILAGAGKPDIQLI